MSTQFPEEKIIEASDIENEFDVDNNNPVINPSHFSDDAPIENVVDNETVFHDPVLKSEPTMPYTAPLPVENSTAAESVVSRSVFYSAQMNETINNETPVIAPAPVSTTLFNHEESELFRTRWNEIQGKFVDEPRSAVQDADSLVSEMVEKITSMFSTEHSALESQWKAGDVVSTEDLRKALQHYRSFFNRLVV